MSGADAGRRSYQPLAITERCCGVCGSVEDHVTQTPPSHLRVLWRNSEAEPIGPADPGYPHGTDLDVSAGAVETCWTALAYPAPRVGAYAVDCHVCGRHVICGTAGRADDPRSIKVACRQPLSRA